MVKDLDEKMGILEFDFASIRHAWMLKNVYFAPFDAFLANNGREFGQKTDNFRI